LYPRAGAVHQEQGFLPGFAVFLTRRNDIDGSHRQMHGTKSLSRCCGLWSAEEDVVAEE